MTLRALTMIKTEKIFLFDMRLLSIVRKAMKRDLNRLFMLWLMSFLLDNNLYSLINFQLGISLMKMIKIYIDL